MPTETDPGSPPDSAALPPFLLVHGAANSAAVWAYWQRALAERRVTSRAVALRGHPGGPPADLARTSMQDYADDVREAMRSLARPVVLVGWSMGGLASMMAAAAGGAVACVGLAPSMPAVARNPSLPLRAGEFGPEEYGIGSRDPDDQPAMHDLDGEERRAALAALCRESRYARDERAAGVVVASLPCPLLIVTSTADAQRPRRRYDGLQLSTEHLSVDGASHWGLVLSRRMLETLVPQVVGWVTGAVGGADVAAPGA
ncbi:MAG: alpha/beta hydrolase [Dehalococcoidia bacterium]|nr:alpha/beta hydrolase [Dehalococcoidia bacterium]